MSDAEYLRLLEKELRKVHKLTKQRDDLDFEITKSFEFCKALKGMLSDEHQEQLDSSVKQVLTQRQTESLSKAIRRLLRTARDSKSPDFFTATQVRDRLKTAGYDFTAYVSNPLASVSTTLRRMARFELETTLVQGVAAYRAKSGTSLLRDLKGD